MNEYQQRVIDEKTQLDERITKLEEFMQLNPYNGSLGEEQQDLLEEQLDCMYGYSAVLGRRIKLFAVSDTDDE